MSQHALHRHASKDLKKHFATGLTMKPVLERTESRLEVANLSTASRPSSDGRSDSALTMRWSTSVLLSLPCSAGTQGWCGGRQNKGQLYHPRPHPVAPPAVGDLPWMILDPPHTNLLESSARQLVYLGDLASEKRRP